MEWIHSLLSGLPRRPQLCFSSPSSLQLRTALCIHRRCSVVSAVPDASMARITSNDPHFACRHRMDTASLAGIIAAHRSYQQRNAFCLCRSPCMTATPNICEDQHRHSLGHFISLIWMSHNSPIERRNKCGSIGDRPPSIGFHRCSQHLRRDIAASTLSSDTQNSSFYSSR